MKHFKYLIFLVCLLQSLISHSQSVSGIEKSFTESTSKYDQFLMHLDTIRKYNNVNYEIQKESLDACESLVEQGLEITPGEKVELALLKSYYLSAHGEAVEVYNLFEKYKYLLDEETVIPKVRSTFLYIEAYNLLSLGDHETAQKKLYKILEMGRNNNDTLSMLQSLYSLGQLHSNKKEYEKAQSYFTEVYELKKDSPYQKRSQLQLLLELTTLNKELGHLDKAERFLEEGFLFDKQENVITYRVDLYVKKSALALLQGKIAEADSAYQMASQVAHEMESLFHLTMCDYQKAKLLNAKGKYKEALTVYEKLIEAESGDPESALEAYSLAHETCKNLGDYKKGYEYVLEANALQESILNDKKKQQTSLLSAKFGAKEKEKENHKLAAEILQKKTQSKYLYALSAFFLLLMIVFIGAFYQKKKYNKRLTKDIQIRTEELKNSNDLLLKTNHELDEFNKILSHDLREPLRSIVGFSTLVERSIKQKGQVQEYLTYINKSGQQLSQLIEDVNVYRIEAKAQLKTPEDINFNELIDSIKKRISPLIEQKNAIIQYPDLPNFLSHKSILGVCFKQIIENGIKYNDSNTPTIQIQYAQKEGQHFFQFLDNGIGIAPQFHEQVFGMFKRLNDRGSYQGSGLGLSIAKKMIEKINGTISILNTENVQGTVFQVSFPVIQNEAIEGQAEAFMVHELN